MEAFIKRHYVLIAVVVVCAGVAFVDWVRTISEPRSITPILAALIGALATAIATAIVRAGFDKRAQDRESDGLRRLLLAEVYFNDFALSIFERPTDLARATTAIWDRDNLKVPQLLTPAETRHIFYYYLGLQMVQKTVQIQYAPEDSGLPEDVKTHVENAMFSGETVRREVQRLCAKPRVSRAPFGPTVVPPACITIRPELRAGTITSKRRCERRPRRGHRDNDRASIEAGSPDPDHHGE